MPMMTGYKHPKQPGLQGKRGAMAQSYLLNQMEAINQTALQGARAKKAAHKRKVQDWKARQAKQKEKKDKKFMGLF